jgi:two-component system, OmpR family, phosphate regulon sensor histidine kinase PhoR
MRWTKKISPRIWGMAWFGFALALVTGMITASFFLTARLFEVMHLSPAPLLVQVINALLGLTLAVVLVGVLGRLASVRGWVPERNVFAPILDALERIAKGDFRVRLESTPEDNQMVGLLANSFNKMALELEQLENLRQEFISNVSHEIQSPLTSIRGFAQALQNDQLSLEDRHHYLSIIEAESTRLSRITEDLLRLAALDAEKARFEPKHYRLDKQIRGLILACEPQWSARQLEMNVTLDAQEITADEDLLSQVWTNLIHNSIKFTPPGGRVCIELHPQGDGIAFTIQDTGIGIAVEDQARIFERFYKADPSRTRSNGGSGLGLAIVKKIVDMHRGNIRVESSMGVGTTFVVWVPLNQGG